MPRLYKRKTEREVDEVNMKHAICAYLRNDLGLNESARQHSIKRTTLQSRLKVLLTNKSREDILKSMEDSGNESNEEEEDTRKKFGNKYAVTQVFTVDQEKQMANYLKQASDLNYGLSYKQVQELAYQYAKALPGCKIPQKWSDKEQAGNEWRKGFMNRNKDLSLRKPESTSLLRGTGFNKSRMQEFFENYSKVLEKHSFTARQIYNLDETGITTVMKPIKVVSSKGKKQVGQVASGERGELVTFVGIINAGGTTIPPIFVYPRVRNVEEYLIEGPVGSIAMGNKSGWMTTDLFVNVLKHIVNVTHCSRENKILLLLDNHESHTSVAAIIFCRKNGIVLLSFPPHTTHRLQPLDVGVFGPFKAKLAITFNDWMLSNAGRAITIKNISKLANNAFLNSFTPKNIISSFRNTGIWPLDRLIFTDQDFAPSSVTDRPLDVLEKTPERDIQEGASQVNETTEPIPGSSSNILTTTSTNFQVSSRFATSTPKYEPLPSTSKSLLEKLRPHPKIDKDDRKKKTRRIESKSRIYTDTPELNLKQNLELDRQRKKAVSMKKKVVKKKIFQPESSDSESKHSFVANDSSEDEGSLDSLLALNDDDNLYVDDFILVRFLKEKKDFCYFIGKVLQVEEKQLTVIFLRRRGNTSNFHFPAIEDISSILKIDVIAKLAVPNKIGTARTLSSFRFNYNFRGYDLR